MIETILTVFPLVAAAFASTNMDNLLLMVGWMMSGKIPRTTILAGYVLGMLGVLLVSYAMGLLSYLVPIQFLGYLGVVPIGLGFKMLWDLWRSTPHEDDFDLNSAGTGSMALILAIALTQLSNGVDTVLVLSPALADSLEGVDRVIIGSFAVMVGVWFGFAGWLSHHAQRIGLITKIGSWLAPFVMITVGIYILADTATDVVG